MLEQSRLSLYNKPEWSFALICTIAVNLVAVLKQFCPALGWALSSKASWKKSLHDHVWCF